MKGGYRPGAGRRPGIKETKPRARKKKKAPEDHKTDEINPYTGPIENLTPLEYMLRIMRDPNEDKERRARMAIAAAPFCHARKGDGQGKKEEKTDKAKSAGAGKFSAGRPPLKLVK